MDNKRQNSIDQQIWQFFDSFRKDLPITELPILLLFLFLKKEGYLDNIKLDEKVNIVKILKESIASGSNEHKEFIIIIFEDFEFNFFEFDDDFLYNIITRINQIDTESLKVDFIEIFERLLPRIVVSNSEISFYQTNDLSKFIVALANLPSKALVYNPFSGLGSIGMSLPKSIRYFGHDFNPKINLTSTLRFLVHGRKILIESSDVIDDWNPIYLKFDLIVGFPPINRKIDTREDYLFGTLNTTQQFFLAKAIQDIKENGKVIMITNTGFLFSNNPTDKLIRKRLVDDDLLEMVISFPSGVIVNTSIPISIIVINKAKENKKIVRFMSTDPFVKKSNGRKLKIIWEKLLLEISNNQSAIIENIDLSVITDNDYNLNPNRFKILEEFSGEKPLSKLGGIVEIAETRRTTGGKTGRLVRIRDLVENELSIYLDIEKIETNLLTGITQELSHSALLLALRWNALKPTYFKYEGESIYLSPNIIALKVDDQKIDIEYLIMELNADYVKKQVDAMRVGTTIPYIIKNDLLKIRVKLPSIELQQESIKEARHKLYQEKVKELEDLKNLHNLDVEIYQQNSFLRHQIAGRLSNVRGAFKNLKTIIEQQLLNEVPELFTYKANKKSQLTFGQCLEILERDIYRIVTVVETNGKEITKIGAPSLKPLILLDFLKNYVKELKNRGNILYEISDNFDNFPFQDDEGNQLILEINGDEELLKTMLDNILENIEVHAFGRQKHADNSVILNLIPDFDLTSIVIEISNTGNPFPPGFNKEMYIRKGSKAGKTGGDGNGGWIINEIIKKHNATYEIFIGEQDIPGFVTSMEISFPLINSETYEL